MRLLPPVSRPARAGRFYAAAATIALTLVTVAGPAAADESTGQGPVGGPHMGSRGVVVNAAPGVRPLPAVQAASWIVADLDTGEVLAAKDPHGRYAPASTLKTLTAVTFIPRLDPAELVKIPYAAGAVDGTKVGVVPGMSYPVRELMMSMLIMSANDAAVSIAMAKQSLADGVHQMNDEAKRLNALDTVARTPDGLDARGQVSSAYDLALIGRAGLAIPDFRRYVATKRSSISAPKHKRYEIYTHNHLLLNYPGAIGIKNGYTVAAKASFVGAAERNGRRLVVALMRGQPLLWKDAAHLLDWGFRADGAVAPVGVLVDPVPPAGTAAAAPAAASSTSALATRPKSSGLNVPVAPLAAAVGVVVLFAGLRLRARRRRGWRLGSRSKFSLPPL